MNHLPLELLVQILVTLPVKTIIRCTSVCKSWNGLIKKPTFTNIPLKHQPSDLMLVVTHLYLSERKYTMYCDADGTFDPYVGLRLDSRFNPLYQRGCLMIGTCNGVICGVVPSVMDEIILWNPTIRKSIDIPSPELPFPGNCSYLKRFNLVYGFGFDPCIDDFKVVRIADFFEDRGLPVPVLVSLRDIKLYSLKTGSWKNITHLAKDIEYCIPKGSRCAFLNGAAHWFGVKKSNTNDTIVIAFNFSDELFSCFEKSPAISFNSELDGLIIPFVIRGSLSLIEHCADQCTIWAMGKYGDSSSWTKHLNINLLSNFNRLVGVRKNGELLIHMYMRFFSFEHKTVDGKERSLQCENVIATYSEDYLPQPGSALMYLGSAFDFPPIYCESFVETMALFGTATSSHVENQCGTALENLEGLLSNKRKREALMGGMNLS